MPGESYLDLLDSLRDAQDQIALITCRHEAAAANMAEAYGKLTGKAGVALVTRGPGATHASIGVHTARHDSTPMLLFVGHVSTDCIGRDAFQEIEYRQFFGAIAKRVFVLDRGDRAAEIVAAAYRHAVSARQGPVVIVLPEDVLSDTGAGAFSEVIRAPQAAPDPEATRQLGKLLSAAERPLIWLGGTAWNEAAVADITHFAERAFVPVVTAFRRKDRFDNGHERYVGELGAAVNPRLVERLSRADLLITLGTRLGEITTQGYTCPAVQSRSQKLVHIYSDADTIGGVYQPTLAIQASVQLGAAALSGMAADRTDADRHAWVQTARAEYEEWIRPPPASSGVDLASVMQLLDREFPSDTLFANGVGNFTAWVHRFHSHRQLHTQLAPTSGAMGYGLPAGIAAKLIYPDREVVVVTGDGDFLMSGSELATAVRYRAKLLILVVDNGQYGTIRMHQAKSFPGRQYGTSLTNPDFAAYARSFGAYGTTVEHTEDFPGVLALARAASGPALIALKTDPDELLPGRRFD